MNWLVAFRPLKDVKDRLLTNLTPIPITACSTAGAGPVSGIFRVLAPGLLAPGLLVPGLLVPGLLVPGLLVPGLLVPGLLVPWIGPND